MKQTVWLLEVMLVVIGIVVVLMGLGAWGWAMTINYYYLRQTLILLIFSVVLSSMVVFYIALVQAWWLLQLIKHHETFSMSGVIRLKTIKLCGVGIALIYSVGLIGLALRQWVFNVGVLMGFLILMAVIIAVFAALLEQLLLQVVEIKTENDLTV